MTEVSAHLLSMSHQVRDSKRQQHKGTLKTQWNETEMYLMWVESYQP